MGDVDVESLFKYAMKGQWREALEAYKENPEASLEAKITKAEDTVLHVAVYLGQTCFVTSVLDEIDKEVSLNVLHMQNSKGNTPLHLAAELGNVELCRDIARRDLALVFGRNLEGESPLFLAAVHGNRDAFFCLQGYSQDDSLARKTNGDTILHSTIASEYFDLALQIIELYPNLVNSVNQDGLSPLHILAGKPNCFKSSTRMELLQSIIYTCSFVDEFEEINDARYDEVETTNHCPMNYGTCTSSLSLLKSIAIGNGRNGASNDEENNGSRKSEQEHAKKAKKPRKEKKELRIPPNWAAMIRFLTHMMKIVLVICGVGASWIGKIQKRKVKHILAKHVMNELIQRTSSECIYDYTNTSKGSINISNDKEKGGIENIRKSTMSPILIAAKMGVAEMVEKILDTNPVAIQDVDSDNKNVVLLAIENRQPHVYSLLNKKSLVKDSAFRQVDNQGNSALHLAATYRSHRPWRVPGAAMQMQWEYKWYKLVKNSMPPNFYERYTKSGKTAKQLFISTHERLAKEGGKWLTKTSESCSVVAALVATVAFTTSTAIPGGPDQVTGYPLFKGKPAFNLFAIASLVALCSSVTALVLFLSILTSRFQEKDFAMDLPRKLLLGLTTLFTSIASVLVSFCAGHFYIVEDQLKYAVYPIYVATCLPVSFFAFVQLPLYFDLSLAMIRKVPQRSYKVLSHELHHH